MVLFYSGTGNTEFVARSIGNILDEKVNFIPHTDPGTLEFNGKHIIFCFPVYSWGVPPLVLEFIKRISAVFIKHVHDLNIPVHLVCTAGDEVAMTVEQFRRAIVGRGLDNGGAWSVIMPNDYVMLPGFNVDPDNIALSKIRDAEPRIRQICDHIDKNKFDTDVIVGKWPKLKSKFIYPLFVKYGVQPKRWQVSAKCISCGKCSSVCPVDNVAIVDGRPFWERNCVSCTACYQVCPVKAISYGSFTNGKGQYYCHLKPLQKI